MSETFDGLNALMDTSPSPAPPPNPQGGKTASGSTLSGEGFTVEMPSGSEYGVMPAGSDSGFISGQNGMPFPMSVSTLPDPANPAPRDNTVRTDDIFSALPTLGLPDISPEDEAAQNEARLAGNASQAGQILSSEDAVDASLGYVRGIGENLLNQQVNDWLNQVGHARIQFGSNKTGDADVLVPLIDNPNSLLFSQIGLRANEERTTTNLGLGYRQYEDGWMWGVNSFYDYDITGSNSRVGVGGELWANYLKFAANGYFRVTDWHQSTLHEMRDYDERPANGFDIRAEGYLPDYPQLGAFAKYEQYFGDGVSLAGTTSSGELKSNPSVSTLGLSYTPFPLITFKGQTSRGDSNDSQIGMELSYRFGVPLSQQLDTDNVDLMRNLAGNRYDFVDRNYNIVMQYRKQELLRIALPPTLNGEAAQTLPVTVSVLKAKYGLKSLRWSAPELLANGGEIKQTGLTTADITLPEYIFMDRNGGPQGYRVTAVGEDNEGNPSNTAEMWVNVIPSVETITKLTVTPNQSLIANNSDQFTAVALLQNDKGEVLANKAVTFSVSGLKNPEGVTIYDADGNSGRTLTVISGPDGTATVKIISKSAGKGLLKAKMRNGNSRTESIVYIADLSTAKIKTLELTNNKAVADGQAKNIAVATVTDQFDNQVENFPLTARADNGATVTDPNQQTDTNGQVTIRFSSETAGDSKLVVEGTGTSKSVTSQFVADISTAKIQSAVVTQDGAKADGKAKNEVLVTVTDSRNNPLAGAPVTIKVPGTARYQTQPVSGLTDSRGQLRISISNTKAGSDNYTFSINGDDAVRALKFVADETTATITDASLVIVTNNQKADGAAANSVKATIVDAYNNPVPGIAVKFVADHGALPSQMLINTDADGNALFELTNTRAGNTSVIAQVNTKFASKTVMFTADSTTAEIKASNLTITADNSAADGTSVNSVKAIVTDAQGNVVPYVAVLFTADNGASPASQSLLTNEQGEVTFSMTSTRAAQVAVKAKINTSEPSVTVTFKADSANPDAQKSSLTADPVTIVADGQTTSTLHFILKDRQGNLIPGQTVVFGTALAGTTVSGTTENPDGTYTATLKGVKAGDAKVSITLNGKAFAVTPVTVKLTADNGNLSGDKSELTAVPDTIVADGKTPSTLTLSLKDVNDNAVSGQTVVFSSALADTVFSTVRDNADGTYTATLKGTKAGTAKIKVTVNNAVLAVTEVSVKLTADTSKLDKDKSSLTAVPDTIVADGNTTTAITLTLRDVNNNPVAGQTALFTTGLQGTNFGTVTDNQDGTYTATLKGTKSGNAQISVTLNGKAFAVAPVTVKLTPDSSNLDKDKSSLTAVPLSIVANDSTTSALTLTLKDANDNPVPGQTVLFSTTLGGTTFSTVKDNQDGTYTATLKGKTAGDAALKVTVNGAVLAVAPVTVKLTADSGNLDKDKSVLEASPLTIVANDSTTSALKLTLRDANGNLVSGQTVLFSTTLGGTTFSGVTDNQDGTYTATLKGKTAGDAALKVTVNGTKLPVAQVTVTLTPDSTNLDKNKSSLTAAPLSIVADDASVSDLKLTLKDANGNLVPGQQVLFSTTLGGTTFSGVTDNHDGTYTATLKGTKAGDALLTVTVNGAVLEVAPVTVKLTADSGNLDKDQSVLEASPLSVVANDTTTSALKLTLKDGNGNLVSGQTVLFSTTLANTTFGTVTDNQDGTYTATLKGKTAGDAVIKVTVGGNPLDVAPVTVTLTPDSTNLDKNKSSLTAVPLSIVADDTSVSDLKLILKDANGNLVPGQQVLFSTTLGGTTFSGVTDNHDGTYTATLKGTKAGDALLTVTVNGAVLEVAPVTVTLTADNGNLDKNQSVLEAAPLNIVANGTAESTLKLTLKDVNGNLVSGQVVQFTTTLADTTFSGVTDNRDGTYTATLKGTKSGDAPLTVIVNGTGLAVAPVTVTLTPDSANPDKDKSVLTAAPLTIVADDTATSSLKLTLKDTYGNLIPGQTVLFSTDLADTTFSTVKDNHDGTYTATLKGTKSGTAALKVTVNGAVLEVAPVSVKLIGDKDHLDEDKSSLTAAPLSIVANNTATSSLMLTLKDVNDNPVIGQTVLFSTDLADTTFSAVKDNQDGTYTATLKGTKAGNALLKVTVNGAVLDVAPVTVKLTADSGNLDKNKSSLTAAPLSIVANNTTTSEVKLTLKDANGNLVSGQTVLFSTTLANTTFGTVTDNQDGTYTATLKGKTAGDAVIKVTVGGNALEVAPVTVTLTADSSNLDNDKSVLEATPLSIVADDATESTLKLTLKDVNGNLVSGQTVLFSTTLGGTTISAVKDNQDGTYTALLKGKTAGAAEIKVTVGGNALEVAPVTVTLTPDSSNLDEGKSSLTAVPLTIVANNITESALTLTLKDVNGNLVPGQTVLFSTGLADTIFSGVTDNQDGTYTATLKGTKAGNALLKVTINGAVLEVAPVTVKLIGDQDNLDKGKSALTADPLTIVANNTTTSLVKLTLKDVNDNPVTGQTVLFSTGLANTTFGTVTDNQDGTYTANLQGKTAGAAVIKVTVGGTELEVAPVTVTLTADSSNLDKEKSSLTAVPLTIVADDATESVLTLTLKDGNDNLVAGQTVLFSTGLADTTFSAVKDNQDGTYTATLKGTKAGDALLKVTVNGAVLEVAPVTVKLTADSSNLDKNKSVLTADPLTIVANNTTMSALKLTLKDANGNLVSGQTVLFSTDLADTTFDTVVANPDGTYTTTLKGTKAGDALLKVTVNGTVLEVAPVTVKLTADSSNLDKNKSSLTAAPLTIVANNTATSEVTLTLKDAYDNPVAGQTVLFSTTLANTTFGTVTDNHDGTYTATLKGTKAGDAEIKVTVGGNVLEVASVTVKLTADSSNLDKDKSVLTATPLTIVANNTATSALKLTLKDANDNPVAGQTVLFSTTLGGTTFSGVTDNQDGTYTATLKGKTAGDAPLTVTVNGTEMPVAVVTVTLTGDAATATITNVKLNGALTRKIANGTDSFEFIAEVRDANGNAVSGVTVNWTSTAGTSAKLSETSQQTDAAGNATVKLTSTKTPVYDIVISAAQGSQTVKADKEVSFEELFSTSVLVIDAIAAGDKPVNGAHVKIFSVDGTELLFETTTDATGKFKVDLVGGKYVVKITANNYDDYDDFMVVKSGADTNFKFALSPALGTEFGRIILQWSEAPNDLDAHLLVPPVGGGSRIHVYYPSGSKDPAGADASLDKDQQSPPGVETITIRKGHKGTYTYFVKRYSAGADAKLSTAKVLLFLNKDLVLKSGTSRMMSFDAPDVVVPAKAQWIVFDIIVDENNEVQVVPKGTVTSVEPT
ncbi:invasin domain 3-containing protein [Morganella morganii]|uniref:invasin domain 3-containing protein n=1 Tax=Morganella morganii TaxID=582 RepID=UPI0032DA60B1